MVEITTTHRATYPASGYINLMVSGQGTPQIHIHHIARDVFGNGIAIRSYGEIKIAAGEFVWSYELGMNTLQVLVLTPELNLNDTQGYMVQKAVWHKGEYDNYASIDIYADDATWQGPGTGPVDGSIWLNYIAVGE